MWLAWVPNFDNGGHKSFRDGGGGDRDVDGNADVDMYATGDVELGSWR